MKNLTVVIPTLLKDESLLNELIDSLVSDDSVQEILIINNNSEKEFYYENHKVRIISKGQNLFVNPSWNLGVKEAKNDYIALINDDIKIPNNLCSSILNLFDDNVGIVGADKDYVIDTRNKNNEIIIDISTVNLQLSDSIVLKPIKYRPHNFGIIMFFKKDVYKEIPEDIKIFYGDDWIIHFAEKMGKTNYVFSNQTIYHLGSLSSRKFADLAKKENRIYKKFIFPMIKRIFNFYETDTHKNCYILGINLSLRKK